jgi:hypothetical protein
MAASTGRSRPLLGFRTVELAARREAFEVLVADIRRAAGGVYMLGLALDHLGEDAGGGGAIVLADLIRRRCEALQQLASSRRARPGGSVTPAHGRGRLARGGPLSRSWASSQRRGGVPPRSAAATTSKDPSP